MNQQLLELEQAVARAAPNDAARVLICYFDPDKGVMVRRVNGPGQWVSLVDALGGGRIVSGAEKLLGELWPEADAEVKRIVLMAASVISKLPFLKSYFKAK